MYPKLTTSFIPIAFNYNIVLVKFTLSNSGTVYSILFKKITIWFLKKLSEYNLKHFPSYVLPALPALYIAWTLDIGTVNRASILVLGL